MQPPNRSQLTLFLLVVSPGAVITAVCGFYVFQDWAALSRTFHTFETLSAGKSDLRSVFVAESMQNVYRINCFAEGVGALLGAVIMAIGIVGMCLCGRPQSGVTHAER
ncbi:hypothetical protein CCAX7_005710 [Capsulimonas corticalis]|uniref:Uncharacterized protein n=1 Tax=Capsulimonas corticalis TaxID=2219043 RepID=A0A402D3A4_9BACT|nr:hypothetical protein [Capsulimonas corticalis]BDI28520.1 hypothetical protein CCAX7_005710 [Capsulimonas corticalis]